MTCPMRMLAWADTGRGPGIADCERAKDHGGDHMGKVAGFETVVVWLNGDRRMFTGELVMCENAGCHAPAGHERGHAY